jgi:hypothetical protein
MCLKQIKVGSEVLLPLSTERGGGSSSVDAIIETMKLRKAQLHKQQQSISEVNKDAESINMVSLTKRKSE